MNALFANQKLHEFRRSSLPNRPTCNRLSRGGTHRQKTEHGRPPLRINFTGIVTQHSGTDQKPVCEPGGQVRSLQKHFAALIFKSGCVAGWNRRIIVAPFIAFGIYQPHLRVITTGRLDPMPHVPAIERPQNPVREPNRYQQAKKDNKERNAIPWSWLQKCSGGDQPKANKYESFKDGSSPASQV